MLPLRSIADEFQQETGGRLHGEHPRARCTAAHLSMVNASISLPSTARAWQREALRIALDRAQVVCALGGHQTGMLLEANSYSAASTRPETSATLRSPCWRHGTRLHAGHPTRRGDFFERGPELSRGNRALELARQAHALLAADPRFEIVTPPRLSVFTFALRAGEDATQRLFEAILADGFLMLSSSRVGGRYVLRFCVANARTTDDDVAQAVARVRALAERE